jgi:ABC-type Na+ efflux pump permease subunit
MKHVQFLLSRCYQRVVGSRRLGIASLILPAVLAVFSITGCNSQPPSGEVSGKVVFDGQPYDAAAVMLIDLTTGHAIGTDIQPGGQFAFEKPVPVGTYSVYLAPKAEPMTDGQPQAVKIDESVPQKYWNESTTDIKKEVTEGVNTFTIELSKA